MTTTSSPSSPAYAPWPPRRGTTARLRDEGLAASRLDGRYTADEIDDDPGRLYHISGPGVGRGWVWDRSLAAGGEPVWVNTARDLAWAMRYNPSMRVLVASDYSDYATPFFNAEFTLGRHGIAVNRVEMRCSEAGHILYGHEPSLEVVARDVRDFILATERR